MTGVVLAPGTCSAHLCAPLSPSDSTLHFLARPFAGGLGAPRRVMGRGSLLLSIRRAPYAQVSLHLYLILLLSGGAPRSPDSRPSAR